MSGNNVRLLLLLLLLFANYDLGCSYFTSRKVAPFRLMTLGGKMGFPDKYTTSNDKDDEAEVETIRVRFTNLPNGKDIVTDTPIGSNLLMLGDKVGVKLPRACRTGLCGSCTCQMEDPLAIMTPSNPRAGFATIRACSTKCFVPPSMHEMVVDVGRMSNIGKPAKPGVKDNSIIDEDETTTDPMARFSGDWEKDFRASWEEGTNSAKKGRTCTACSGSGRVSCYSCEGKGQVLLGSTQTKQQCPLCVGICTLCCSKCRGVGLNTRKKLKT
tara:strand:- start:129 stop:938 length:810 start_codon:yes stop_codon:yes gene_type:complete